MSFNELQYFASFSLFQIKSMFSALARKQKENEVTVERPSKKQRMLPDPQAVPSQSKDEISDDELIQIESDLENYEMEEEELDLRALLLSMDDDAVGAASEITSKLDPHPILVYN